MSKAWTMAVATALAAAAAPVLGAEFTPPGDGSDVTNADLLRDGPAGCESCQDAPHEWGEPPFELDWQLGLRGAVVEDGSGLKVQFLALPEATWTHRALRGGYSAGVAAELSYDLDGTARVGSLTLKGSADYRFDAVTGAELKSSLNLSQADPEDPGTADNVAQAPLVLAGAVEASVRRDLGPFAAELRGSAGRTLHGDTTYDDASTTSNEFQNTTVAGLGSRLGYKLTSGVTAFVDGEANHETYDAPSPSLLVKLDNVTYEARAGLNAKFLSVVELEGSLGLAYRDFADAAFDDFTAVLYDARAIFRPDPTLTLTGTLSTTLDSPGTTSGATAKLTYAATGEAAYQLNPWLRLRGSAGWSEAHYQGVAVDETKWNVGLGADYLLTEHMDATADYTYAQSTTTPDPAKEEQRLMLGLKVHR
ncbi:MAG: outer membrane beta-barrel protein [Devosia sp.]